jgi:hypothetical protein
MGDTSALPSDPQSNRTRTSLKEVERVMGPGFRWVRMAV